MHPYIAYIILSNPANRNPRPDECCVPLRTLLRQAVARFLARVRSDHRPEIRQTSSDQW